MELYFKTQLKNRERSHEIINAFLEWNKIDIRAPNRPPINACKQEILCNIAFK